MRQRNLKKSLEDKYFWFLLGYYYSINNKAKEAGFYIYNLKDYEKGYKIKCIIDTMYKDIVIFCKVENLKLPPTFEEFVDRN